ncbi:hypothetical protein [Acinetobacter pseudolwoffii]|nr:hypothetical protein [Acinetobacter pseudolwoffii]
MLLEIADFFEFYIEERGEIAKILLLENKKKRIDKMMIKNKKAPDGAFL